MPIWVSKHTLHARIAPVSLVKLLTSCLVGVIEDAKYKRQDALKDLSKAAEKMLAEERK